VGTEVVLREIAPSGAHLADLAPTGGLEGDAGADRERVPALLPQLEPDPVVTGALAVLEDHRHVVDVAEDEVEVPVVVEVADGEAAARPGVL